MICLVPHCGYLSETSRMLAIYKALVARGAQACIATHGGTHEGFLRDAGVPCHFLKPRMSPERCRRFVASSIEPDPMRISLYTEEEARSEVLAQVRFFREHKVQAAVTGFTLTTLVSTRIAGIPLAASYAGSFVPPVFERGIAPAASRPGAALGRLPAWFRRWLTPILLPRILGYVKELNTVARDLGAAEIPSMAAMFLGDLTCVTEIPEVLGIPREELESWKPRHAKGYRPNCRLRYTGPIFAELELPIPQQVEDFLAPEDGRPVIYLAIASTPPELVRGVIPRLRATGARLLVASTVHDLEGCTDGDVLVAGFLPSHRIMPRVDLCVIAGGQGSVQCSLASGTPFVGIPLQGEQDLNVHLAEKLGAAKLVPMVEATGPRMTAAAQALLGDARARESARRVRDLYSKVNGPDAAAQAILELVASAPTSA